MQVNRLKELRDGFIVAVRPVQPSGDDPASCKLFNPSINMAEIAFDQTNIQISWPAGDGRGIIIAA
jgi:hypothetical protein